MKNEQLYHKTVDILVQAYFNDTLEHENCYACAVGNLIAANCGFKLTKHVPVSESYRHTTIGWDGEMNYGTGRGIPNWIHAVRTKRIVDYPDCVGHINATGYTLNELSMIEKAFEGAHESYEPNDAEMFNGLMAVIEVLDQIHENTDTEITQTSKKRFAKAS